tara:strand:- start:1738 stop:2640 length:903 start_codon:yes stop_codon:yes gene_type:complete
MNIVLIHLGDKKINHVTHTLNQLIRYNNKNIYFIAEKKHFPYIKKKIISNINFIDKSELVPSNMHLLFKEKTRLDKKSLDGFWYNTTERFFYLESFCTKKKFKNIIHLENDMLIFDNLSKYIDKFKMNYNIGFTFLNENLCVPGFIYFKNYKYINLLTKYIYSQNRFFFQKKNLNDMKLIAKFYNKTNYNKIGLLPTLSESIVKELNLTGKNYYTFYKNFKNFKILFDACALGQKIDGLDRNFHKHKGSYINKLNIFNPRNVEIVIKKIKNNKKPFIRLKKVLIPIINIHMHSKRTDYFK